MPHCLLFLAGFFFLFAGCATAPPLPPIAENSSDNRTPGRILFHDLATRDLDTAIQFYRELFGWSFAEPLDGPRQYTLIYHQEKPIGGIFRFEEDEADQNFGEWLPSISTKNVDADARAFAEAGGAILGPPRNVPDRGRMAFIRDPLGAHFILLQSASGDPPPPEIIPHHDWLWNELWTGEPAAMAKLYSRIFDYEQEKAFPGDDGEYVILRNEDRFLVGIHQLPVGNVRPHWVPFIRVQNVPQTVARARELGASVMIEPQPDIREGKVALLLGPTGEPFMVQEYEF